MALFDVSGHCRTHFQSAMRFDEVVISEMERNCSLKIFQFFAESICQSAEPAAMHSQRVILLFNMGSRNQIHIRRALHNRFFSTHNFCGTIPNCRFFTEINDGVGFYNLRVINICTKTVFNRFPIGVERIG
jgi:hypothetical protein